MAMITIIGSANIDYITDVIDFPKPGETISATGYRIEYGGKGANQAVASARLGAPTSFVACVGSDREGAAMIEEWKNDAVDVSSVNIIDEVKTGTAQICVNSNGENNIVVAGGANRYLSEVIVEKYMESQKDPGYLLLQLEIPLRSTTHAAKRAKEIGYTVVLNPAPATVVPDNLLKYVDIITPNESEVYTLTGVRVSDKESACKAAKILHDKGIRTVVVTLGSKGAFISTSDGKSKIVGSYRVPAVDTVAAGDTFNAAMLVYLNDGYSLEIAVDFANAAAAITVSRLGAQRSIPSREEVLEFLELQRTKNLTD